MNILWFSPGSVKRDGTGLGAKVETPPHHKHSKKPIWEYCHIFCWSWVHISCYNENKIPSELLHDFCVNQALEYVLPSTTGTDCSGFTAGVSEVSRVIQTQETEACDIWQMEGSGEGAQPGFLSQALTLVIVSAPCSRLFLHSQPP